MTVVQPAPEAPVFNATFFSLPVDKTSGAKQVVGGKQCVFGSLGRAARADIALMSLGKITQYEYLIRYLDMQTRKNGWDWPKNDKASLAGKQVCERSCAD